MCHILSSCLTSCHSIRPFTKNYQKWKDNRNSVFHSRLFASHPNHAAMVLFLTRSIKVGISVQSNKMLCVCIGVCLPLSRDSELPLFPQSLYPEKQRPRRTKQWEHAHTRDNVYTHTHTNARNIFSKLTLTRSCTFEEGLKNNLVFCHKHKYG